MGAPTLGSLAQPVAVLSGEAPAGDVESWFAERPAVLAALCRHGGRDLLLLRSHTSTQLSGRLGFGRALLARHSVADLALCPLILARDCSLPEAAAAMLARAPERQYDEVIVELADGRPGLVSPTSVFVALAEHYGRQAATDGLTGLPNRSRLLREFAQPRPDDDRFAVVYLDLDGFKAVNDSLGHAAGDGLLRSLAERLRAAVRPEHLLCRLGGDEFGLLVHDPAVALEAAEQLLAAAVAPYVVNGRSVVLTATAGIAVGRGGAGESALSAADRAMYRGKRAGGARIVMFDPAVDNAVDELQMSQELREAIRDGALALHYQPIVRLGDRAPVGVEALLRWTTAHGREIPPSTFVPFAESHGLMPQLGRLVLDAACQQARLWLTQLGPDRCPVVSVNLSAVQLSEDAVVEEVQSALLAHHLPAQILRLEVTETSVMRDPGAAAGRLNTLRAMGCSIALDDFGTGYSSLAVLRQLPLDVLKLDRAFVLGLAEDPVDRRLARLIIDIAHTLGLSVTAEGIETREQEAVLLALGCDLAQGYLYGRPCLPASLTSLELRRSS